MKPHYNILLIDDDEEDFIITRDLISEFKEISCDFDWNQSYEEEILTIKKYDIFLVDYRLGLETGLDVTNKLRRLFPDVIVIILTGMADSEVDRKVMKAGASDYLVKGKIDAEQLERTIRYALEHAQHLTKIRELNQDLEKRVEDRTAQLSLAVKDLESANTLLANQIEENKKANIELLKSQQMLATIAQNYPNGIISVYNKNLTCEFIEGQELQKLGLSKLDFLGKTINETFDNYASEIHTSHFDKTLLGENTIYELLINNNNYLFYTTPIKDDKGIIARIVVVCLNISKVKEAEEKTRQALDKANELSELKSRFISMASHEFRTPLSTILSSLNLMMKYKDLNEHLKFASHGAKIKNSIINLTEILEYFLSVEKLDSGHFKIEPTSFDLVDFINTNIDEVVNDLKDKQRIVLQLSLKKIMINHDKKIIRTIWQNLITNAIKYSPENGEIIVHLLALGDRFILSVKDNGIGIPENEQKNLFERFYRANNASNIQGTGIGLNIIKKYIELLGGSITFTSILNEGTTFTVNLPLVLKTEIN